MGYVAGEQTITYAYSLATTSRTCGKKVNEKHYVSDHIEFRTRARYGCVMLAVRPTAPLQTP